MTGKEIMEITGHIKDIRSILYSGWDSESLDNYSCEYGPADMPDFNGDDPAFSVQEYNESLSQAYIINHIYNIKTLLPEIIPPVDELFLNLKTSHYYSDKNINAIENILGSVEKSINEMEIKDKGKTLYEVQTYSLADGWSNTWTVFGDKEPEYPEVFESEKEAEEAIAEEIADTQAAIENGDMDKDAALVRDDFDIVELEKMTLNISPAHKTALKKILKDADIEPTDNKVCGLIRMAIKNYLEEN